MRQKIVAGNWKMNKTLEEANILATEIKGHGCRRGKRKCSNYFLCALSLFAHH